MNVIVDTSVWIHFFRGKFYPEIETALKEGRVYLTGLIAAELLSGVSSPSEEKKLTEWIDSLPLLETPLRHWLDVGRLRNKCLKKGLSISTPDGHIAQATLDLAGLLLTSDRIFSKLPTSLGVKVTILD